MCKEAGCSNQTSVSGNLKRHAKALTAMDFQPHKTTFNHMKPLLTTKDQFQPHKTTLNHIATF